MPTAEKVEDLLRSGEPHALAEALIGLALGSDEFAPAFQVMTSSAVTEHEDPGVRGAAILALGHLARIHRQIPEEPTLALIERALRDQDGWVRGQAENALSDIGVFAPSVAAAYRARTRC